MAYAKDIHVKCSRCTARATKEVFNQYNASCGRFCSKCAKERVNELKNMEEAEYDSRTRRE